MKNIRYTTNNHNLYKIEIAKDEYITGSKKRYYMIRLRKNWTALVDFQNWFKTKKDWYKQAIDRLDYISKELNKSENNLTFIS